MRIDRNRPLTLGLISGALIGRSALRPSGPGRTCGSRCRGTREGGRLGIRDQQGHTECLVEVEPARELAGEGPRGEEVA
jgi:hypothetical protein